MLGWSLEENEAVVADYFDMWSAHLRREAYSKAAHWRQLQRTLQVRSKGAIEKKHGNISAALHDLGYPSLPGYQPYRNYQQILGEIVAAHLAKRQDIVALVARDAERTILLPPEIDAMSILIEGPSPKRRSPVATGRPRRPVQTAPPPINYLERQAQNAALGRAGEELVVRFEQQRLATAGKGSLAKRVEHVAVTRGASAGFDVLSFEESGVDRLIEVKTTTWGRETPFYVTANEFDTSEENADQYHLYRLYEFQVDPQLSAKRMVLKGPLSRTCLLRPSVYRATTP